MQFSGTWRPKSLYIIGIGRCMILSMLSVTGLTATGTDEISVFLQNIDTGTNGVSISGTRAPIVTCLGKTYINSTLSTGVNGKLILSPESWVASTNASSIDYIATASGIGYKRRDDSDASFPDDTVAKELDVIGRRKVRVSNIIEGSSGFIIDDGSSYVDVQAETSGGYEVFDLRDRDRVIVSGINKFVKRNENPEFESVTAARITAEEVVATQLRINTIALGGYRLEIDGYGYLVVVDGSDTPPRPPESLLLIRDSVTGAMYMIGVYAGRLYIAPAEGEDDSSSSSSYYGIQIYDPHDNRYYDVTLEDGRLTISRE